MVKITRTVVSKTTKRTIPKKIKKKMRRHLLDKVISSSVTLGGIEFIRKSKVKENNYWRTETEAICGTAIKLDKTKVEIVYEEGDHSVLHGYASVGEESSWLKNTGETTPLVAYQFKDLDCIKCVNVLFNKGFLNLSKFETLDNEGMLSSRFSVALQQNAVNGYGIDGYGI